MSDEDKTLKTQKRVKKSVPKRKISTSKKKAVPQPPITPQVKAKGTQGRRHLVKVKQQAYNLRIILQIHPFLSGKFPKKQGGDIYIRAGKPGPRRGRPVNSNKLISQ